jgi:hypothetical protein
VKPVKILFVVPKQQRMPTAVCADYDGITKASLMTTGF